MAQTKDKYLSQIISHIKAHNEEVSGQIREALQIFGNGALLSGHSKVYTPFEEGDQNMLPADQFLLRRKVCEIIDAVRDKVVSQWNAVATQEWTNTLAKADVITSGGEVSLVGVPAAYLLFLKKHLAEVEAFIKAIPVLDPALTWGYDPNQDCYVTVPEETTRTIKVESWLKLCDPTPTHPAQFTKVAEDKRVGTYRTVRMSGAVSAQDKNRWMKRVAEVRLLVEDALVEANRHPAHHQDVSVLLTYIFG